MEEPTVLNREAFTVVGPVYRGTNDNQEIPRLWRTLLPRFSELNNLVQTQVSYGVMGNMNQESGEFDYLAGYEFAGGGKLPEGMETWSVPAQKYAVFPATLPTLMEVFGYINENWFPRSGYSRTGGPEFELYGEEFNPQDSNSVLYLYIPVS